MRKLATLLLSIFVLAVPAFADSPKDDDAQPAIAGAAKEKTATKAAKTDAAPQPAATATPEKTDAALAAEIEELRQAIQAQQEQLQVLKEELTKRDKQIDEAREAAAFANARAREAVNSTASVKATTESLNSTASSRHTNDAVLTTNAANAEAAGSSTGGNGQKPQEEGPASIHVKGITITPGGFLAAESVYRTRATSSDINTPFTNIPFPGSGLSRTSEFNASGRQSRLSFLFQGKADTVALTGYYELDWLGACATSNNRQSNSYCMRQRQIWGQAVLPSGWAFTGGQMWSLATETKNGLDNRTELLPMTIDPQYSVGFTWARQYGFRVTKNFNNKVWFGASVEGPQTTLTTHNLPTGIFALAPGNGGGLFNSTDGTGYSVNATPDFIFKLAFQPGWGHYEIFGIISNFRARIYPCDVAAGSLAPPAFCAGSPLGTAAGAFNSTATGGGVGVNLRVPLVAKKVDFGVHVLGGDGIGRYSSAQLKDVTTRPDGTLVPLRGGSALGTLELHPSTKLDVYFNYGVEFVKRGAYTYTNLLGATVAEGYGSPLFNNSGCEAHEAAPAPGTVNAPASAGGCTGDLRNVQEATVGFWHHAYKSSKGEIRWGLQYSYLPLATWSGNNNTPTAPGVNGKANDSMLFTSFRYYIP